MENIKGNSTENRFMSVDGILGRLLSKQTLLHKALNKKNRRPFSFNISGYVDTCISGDIICAYFTLSDVSVKRSVIVLDDCAKDAKINLIVRIIDKDGTESINKVAIKKGLNTTKDERDLKQGDRVAISIEFEGESPKGIWVAMRGEQL